MKHLIISISLLIMFFGFAPLLAGTEDANDVNSEPAGLGTDILRMLILGLGGAGDANSITDSNAVAEPNAIKEFEGLKKAVQRLNYESQRERREWMDENRASLAKAVQSQIAAELGFLRELAVKEGAVMTTAAIDRLLESRDKRFEKMLKKMQEQGEKPGLGEQEPTRYRRPSRSTILRERRKALEEERRSRRRPSRRERRKEDDEYEKDEDDDS